MLGRGEGLLKYFCEISAYWTDADLYFDMSSIIRFYQIVRYIFHLKMFLNKIAVKYAVGCISLTSIKT